MGVCEWSGLQRRRKRPQIGWVSVPTDLHGAGAWSFASAPAAERGAAAALKMNSFGSSAVISMFIRIAVVGSGSNLQRLDPPIVASASDDVPRDALKNSTPTQQHTLHSSHAARMVGGRTSLQQCTGNGELMGLDWRSKDVSRARG